MLNDELFLEIHDATTNRIVYVNHSGVWKEQFEERVYNADDDLRVELLIYPEDKEKASDFLKQRKLLADGETLEIELRNKSVDREWGWLRIRSKVFKRDEEGRAVQIISFTTNITAEKEAELNSERNSYLLQLTTEASPDAITIFDLEKKEPLYLNSVLSNWLGYTNQQLEEMGFDERLKFIHKNDRERLLAHNQAMLTATDHEVRSVEYRLVTKEGKIMWLCNRTKVFKRNPSGKITQILSVIQDISDRKA